MEDLRANNVETQEEDKHLKEKVQMFNWRMAKMEKHLEKFNGFLVYFRLEIQII